MGVGYLKNSKIFISYSHKDQKYLDELLLQLGPLIDAKCLDCWNDQKISAGQLWQQEIKEALRSATVAVLLVSPSFLASDFITRQELPFLLEAARRGDLRILWIPFSACSYESMEISEYQAVHPPEKPLNTLRNPKRQQALVRICKMIVEAATNGKRERRPCLEPATLAALTRGELPEDIQELVELVEHLVGIPSRPGCRECQEQIATRFLDAADRTDPEVAAGIAVREGSLASTPGLLAEILGGEAAGPKTLARWERWAKSRRGAVDPSAIAPVILASFALRFKPDKPGLLSHARLAVTLADAAEDPWLQAIAHAWLARVHSIRGDMREASREIDAGLLAVRRLKGSQHTIARAFALHQLADLQLRLRKFKQARKNFERAIELYPPDMAQSAKYSLALTYTEAGQYGEARGLIRKILTESGDRLLVTSALQTLTGEILPNLAREEGNAELAALALSLRAVVRETQPTEIGPRARALWRNGRLAWALDAPELSLAFYKEARAVFRPLAQDVFGMYEFASISLDMIEALLESGSLEELQDLALQAAGLFSALGVATSSRLALGLVQQLQTRAGVGAYLEKARIAFRSTEKKYLPRAEGRAS